MVSRRVSGVDSSIAEEIQRASTAAATAALHSRVAGGDRSGNRRVGAYTRACSQKALRIGFRHSLNTALPPLGVRGLGKAEVPLGFRESRSPVRV